MSEDTKARALEKLAAFTPKIGYPDHWRDYSALVVRADDLIGNARRAAAFELDRQLAKIGKPVDRLEWFMSPQTVNAYYNPGMNEIVFPAAILQPPFFDPAADDAVNYGAIGAVIGHEIGHGFDDQGSKYDGRGALHDWWTAQDREAFDVLTRKLIEQYDVAGARADARASRQRRADRRREHRRPRRSGDRLRRLADLAGRRGAAGDRRPDRRAALLPVLGDRVADARSARPSSSGCCRSTRIHRPSSAATRWCATSTSSSRRSTCRPATGCGWTRRTGSGSGTSGSHGPGLVVRSTVLR